MGELSVEKIMNDSTTNEVESRKLYGSFWRGQKYLRVCESRKPSSFRLEKVVSLSG